MSRDGERFDKAYVERVMRMAHADGRVDDAMAIASALSHINELTDWLAKAEAEANADAGRRAFDSKFDLTTRHIIHIHNNLYDSVVDVNQINTMLDQGYRVFRLVDGKLTLAQVKTEAAP